MKRQRPQSQPAVTAEQVLSDDAQQRLREALALILRAAARAEGDTIKCAHDVETMPEQADDRGVGG